MFYPTSKTRPLIDNYNVVSSLHYFDSTFHATQRYVQLICDNEKQSISHSILFVRQKENIQLQEKLDQNN